METRALSQGAVESDCVVTNDKESARMADIHTLSGRLITFQSFPISIPVKPIRLAQSGFYYTGFSDRVKCFSCGVSVENWEAGDDENLSRWHKSNCHLLNENLTSNSGNYAGSHDPLLTSLDLCKESDRRRTFDDWPPFPNLISGPELAKEGFFYLGQDLMTQCFSCWDVFDDWTDQTMTVNAKHKTQKPSCRMANGTDASNITILAKATRDIPTFSQSSFSPFGRESMTQQGSDQCVVAGTRSSLREGAVTVPQTRPKEVVTRTRSGTTPVRSFLASVPGRLETFRNGWPNRTRATPQQLAEAGFHYMGEKDLVSCFSCIGGLRNWEYEDDPWVEHAKWFPSCKFVRQQKGGEFVDNVIKMFPNLQRPEASNLQDFESPSTSQPQDRPPSIHPSSMLSETDLESAVMRDPETIGQLSVPASLFHLTQRGVRNAAELQNVEVGDVENCIMYAGQVNAASFQMFILPGGGLQPAVNVQRLDDARYCHMCQQSLAEIVFMPCQHFVTCVNCACTLPACLLCGQLIRDKVKVHTG